MDDTVDFLLDWQPFCAALYPTEKVAGDPIVCDNEPHDRDETKHRNSELGFEWWD
jgi:hypothetical protein